MNEHTPQDGTASDEEFMAFLASADQAEQARQEFEASAQEVHELLDAAIAKHGVDTLVRMSHDDDDEMRDRWVADLTTALIDDDLSVDWEEAEQKANLIVGLEVQEHIAILGMAAMNIQFARYTKSDEDRDRCSDSKKRLIAQWMHDQRLDFGSPWVRMLNDVMPGEDLAPGNADEYFILAIEKAANQAQINHERNQDIGRALSVAGIADIALGDLRYSTLYVAALQSRQESPNREEHLDEVAREVGITPAQIRLFVNAINV